MSIVQLCKRYILHFFAKVRPVVTKVTHPDAQINSQRNRQCHDPRWNYRFFSYMNKLIYALLSGKNSRPRPRLQFIRQIALCIRQIGTPLFYVHIALLIVSPTCLLKKWKNRLTDNWSIVNDIILTIIGCVSDGHIRFITWHILNTTIKTSSTKT